jgi:glycosyltransferase involved in cell wall biosynthesis
MRLLYIVNGANHHQLPIGASLAAALGADCFRFVATAPLREERVLQGWGAAEGTLPSWVILPYRSDAARREFENWCADADVVISGVIDFALFSSRLKRGKLTFYMSERWLRPGFTGAATRWTPDRLIQRLLGRHAGKVRLVAPWFARRAWQMRRLSANKAFHYLTMGYYCAADMACIGAFRERVWNWAYFGEVPEQPPMDRANSEVTILWAGRLLALKRVDTLVEALGILRKKELLFRLEIIGRGPEEARLARMARALGIEERISFESNIPAKQVRARMRRADVYVLPSSETEGWGMVVSEAMADGCAVVASTAAGASMVLIEDGINGMLSDPGDAIALSAKLEKLIRDPDLRRRMGHAAWQSMHDLWRPRVGAERLVALCSALVEGHTLPVFTSGPCRKIR